MKKLVAFLLLFALVFAFCGCQSDENDIRGTYDDTSSTVSDEKGNDTNSDDGEFSTGNRAGNIYKSDFIGISYKLDNGWSFYNDQKINELNNIATDLTGDALKEAIKNATVVYDMCAVDENQLNSVNVNLEKVNVAQLLALNIANNFKAVAPTLVDSFKNMGYTNIEYKVTTVKVDGKDMDALYTTAEINGVKMYQTMFAKKCNGYLANFCITTFGENKNADLIDNFEWLD